MVKYVNCQCSGKEIICEKLLMNNKKDRRIYINMLNVMSFLETQASVYKYLLSRRAKIHNI